MANRGTSTATRLVVSCVIGFGLSLAYWAVPGGRGYGSLAEALLVGAVTSAVVFVYGTAKRKMRTTAKETGQAMRRARDSHGA